MIHKTSLLAAAIVLLPIGLTGADAFCDASLDTACRPAVHPPRLVYGPEFIGPTTQPELVLPADETDEPIELRLPLQD